MTKCKICRGEFQKRSMSHKTCSIECAIALVKNKRETLIKRETKARLLEMQPTRYWWKLARTWFNKSVRLRDEGKECISCPTILTRTGKVGGDYDCGHFLSVGTAKHLEFDPRNTAGQCKHCNMRKQGASATYRPKLIERIGLEAVEALEADQTPRRLRTDDYKRIIAESKAECKRLEAKKAPSE